MHRIWTVSQQAVSLIHVFGTDTVHWELKWDMVIGRKGKVLENNAEADSPIPNSETIAFSEYRSQEYR